MYKKNQNLNECCQCLLETTLATMVKIEGTYTSVKGQEFADYLICMGIPKEEAQKAVGTHWTMKLWKEGATTWGFHWICDEEPSYNTIDFAAEGIEKCFEHPLLGGKAKSVFTRNGDGFTTVTESVFGKLITEEKYTEDGIELTNTCNGKTFSETWKRSIKVGGCYIYEKGENLDAYFKAVGFNDFYTEESMRNYKMHVTLQDDTFILKEYFGDRIICNTSKLDVESPFRYPDDTGEVPKRLALTTKISEGKYLFVVKSPDGINEEWTFTYKDDGLIMSGTENKTNETCKTYLKRTVDMSGTWRMVASPGFEAFVKAIGFPHAQAEAVIQDTTAKMTITDFGNGRMRNHFVGKAFSMDMSFKLNEEFTFFHPMFQQNVTGLMSKCGSTLTMVLKSGSKGTFHATIYVNDTFSVNVVRHHGTNMEYTIIMERC